jgi:hypothetical protein
MSEAWAEAAPAAAMAAIKANSPAPVRFTEVMATPRGCRGKIATLTMKGNAATCRQSADMHCQQPL